MNKEQRRRLARIESVRRPRQIADDEPDWSALSTDQHRLLDDVSQRMNWAQLADFEQYITRDEADELLEITRVIREAKADG